MAQPSPGRFSRKQAIASHTEAWVYCPPFSRTPAG